MQEPTRASPSSLGAIGEGVGLTLRYPDGECRVALDREFQLDALAVGHEGRALGRAVAAALEELGQTGQPQNSRPPSGKWTRPGSSTRGCCYRRQAVRKFSSGGVMTLSPAAPIRLLTSS